MSGSGAALGTVTLSKTLLEPWQLREADDFELATVPIEVWVRAQLPTTAVSPRVVASWQPDGLVGREFVSEGLLGVPMVLPSSAVQRFFRVGVLTFDRLGAELLAGRPVTVFIDFTYGAGSSGNLDVDYIVFVSPVRTALTPTGRTPATVNFANTYPSFLPASSGVKRVLPNLTATFRQAGDAVTKAMRHAGVGGALPGLPPGDSSVFVKVSNKVPDDPASSATADAHDFVDLHLEVRPAWNLVRA